MADNTDWFADVEAALADSTDTPAPEEVTEESTSLESQDPPSDDDPLAAEENPLDEENTQEEQESTESEEEVTEQVAAEAETTPPLNWDSEENPHYQKSRQLETMQARARAIIDQAAQARAYELQNERIKTLADDDPQRMTEIQQLVQEAQRPVLQQAQQLEGEVETVAKLATVIDEAVRQIVPSEFHAKIAAEVERMMALPGGPEQLQRDLATRKAERSGLETELASERQKVKELERRLAARSVLNERAANGADAVESGQGNALSYQDRWDAASNFDEAFDAIVSSLPH